MKLINRSGLECFFKYGWTDEKGWQLLIMSVVNTVSSKLIRSKITASLAAAWVLLKGCVHGSQDQTICYT